VEALTAASGYATTALSLTGNEFAQTIVGNYGNNILNGGGGADTMFGLAGNDSFAFTAALGGGNVDALADFEANSDKILLAGGAGRPFAVLPAGPLAENSFVTGTAAADANDHIIFNPETGQMFYDADGNGVGAALLFATVTPATQLSAANFLVI
jgi:Ca2+-binding RTX toxin-like protein